MICRERLLKSIQSVHAAIISYASCMCEEVPLQEREILYKFGLELSLQLQELRKLYTRLYKIDPLSRFEPTEINRFQKDKCKNLDYSENDSKIS